LLCELLPWSSFDSTIVGKYAELAIPADPIVADPQFEEAFRDAVNHHLSPELQVDQPTLNRRLLNLGRRGEDIGGPPREQMY
jgi:hypothetical protein